jgi:hypothetical protein
VKINQNFLSVQREFDLLAKVGLDTNFHHLGFKSNAILYDCIKRIATFETKKLHLSLRLSN